jgi:hypothetical protein
MDYHIEISSIVQFVNDQDFIKQYSDPYLLFQNFIVLFEYLDIQSRINLVSKKNKMGIFERLIGVHSQNEYRGGTEFNLLEMSSHIQLAGYKNVLSDLGISLEKVLHEVFTSLFQEKYEFANNCR